MLHIVGSSQELDKILVVSDNKQLEVALARTTLDYPAKKPMAHLLVSESVKWQIKILFCHVALAVNKLCFLFKDCLYLCKKKTHSTSACAKDSIFSLSKLVVGSSSARIPQFRQNVSARANRIMREARTYRQTSSKHLNENLG